MSSENETVEAVLREIDEAHETWKRSEIANLPTQYLKEWHDRIESAWRRENDELRKCLKEAIDYNCATCKSKGKACEVEGFCAEHRWRKVLEGAAK